MSTPDSHLDPATHARVFVDDIIPESGLNETTSQARPRAIILGGQPGAGKGGLARAARDELSKDAVTIDPDELRDFHPNAERLQSVHPYTWSGDTHPDASQWANELKELAVQQKKNIIIDTTLGHGDSAVRLVNSLQDAGYEVAASTAGLAWQLGIRL
ncbi:MAG: zeta toxin family protein [Xanthomonadaceae bacterium]|jgi:predicted ABC-type ATPase|nr:zeta toxin family protein [Xanthomonadaceae bacterium]